MSGSAGLFNKKIFFFYLVGSPKVGGAGDGKHKKKYGHPIVNNTCSTTIRCQTAEESRCTYIRRGKVCYVNYEICYLVHLN